MKHHYIPQFYLKHWESVEGIYCYHYQFHNFLMVTKQASEVGFLPNLNSIQNEKGELDHTIETIHFNEHDNCSSQALMKIIKYGIDSINAKEKEDWCDFIIGLLFRHPSMMNLGLDDIERAIKDFEPLLTPELKNSSEFKNFRNNYHQELIRNTTDKTSDSELKTFLLELNWSLLDFEKSALSLLTGDRPAGIYSLDDRIIRSLDDFKEANIYLTLPLTPKKCFIATNPKNNINDLKFSQKKLIRNLNLVLVKRAAFYVFAKDNQAYSFIKKNMQDLTETKGKWQNRLKR